MRCAINYKEAGVDIVAGNALVEAIKPIVKLTNIAGVLNGIGSFSGAFAVPPKYKKPVMLAAADGVGTKLRLAVKSGILNTIGIDLVAMCVNDIICNRGEPLFFLDYYASGRLKINSAKQVIEGIAAGCVEAQCALIGGETAEMPGIYHYNDFDLAGFAVGMIEEEDFLNPPKPQKGDRLVALPSSGLHSNGFALVNELLLGRMKMSLNDIFDGENLINLLLKPTEIYVKRFKAHRSDIKAVAHITGGGIVENLPRSLPKNIQAVIEKRAIKTPAIFTLLGKYVEEKEMFSTFNMGVGMIWVVDKNNAQRVADSAGGYIIGELIEGEKQVVFN